SRPACCSGIGASCARGSASRARPRPKAISATSRRRSSVKMALCPAVRRNREDRIAGAADCRLEPKRTRREHITNYAPHRQRAYGDTKVNATDYGFIGVGRMGANMARRLLDGGFSLTVYDASRRAVDELVAHGAQGAASAAEVADNVETLFLSLPTPDIIHAVALGQGGIIEGSRVRHVFDCSTIGPEMAKTVAAGLAERGGAPLDGPVRGGGGGAQKRPPAVMVSGPRESYERTRPARERFGSVFHVGTEPGQGQVMKLANNLLSAAALVLSSEAIALGVKAGLDAAQMVDVINAGTGRNSATQDKFPRSVLPRTFDFGFATGLCYKDLKLCVQAAENL